MTKELTFENIPESLRAHPQWVLWKMIDRDGRQTKIPFQVTGEAAKTNDWRTWESFANVCREYSPSRHAGIGFVFSPDDAYFGIDLDGCRDPETGIVSDWAKEIILKFDSYAEVSPSRAGVKIFCRGDANALNNKKTIVKGDAIAGKTPGIEVYSSERYFAVTGWRLKGPSEVNERTESLAWLREKYWSSEPATSTPLDYHSTSAVIERARKYLAKVPPAIAGQRGHNQTYHAACILRLDFELDESDATALLLEWNQTCQPPWTDAEIARKVREAGKASGPRGKLRSTKPENFERVKIKPYESNYKPEDEIAPPTIRVKTIADASREYLEVIRNGGEKLLSTSIIELDKAIGGGIAPGELFILAALPSHGKSAVGLQMLHSLTETETPCMMISEEMSSIALGKRSVQFISDVPIYSLKENLERVSQQIDWYEKVHQKCFVVEGCQNVKVASEQIEYHVKEHGVKVALVDYAQLLDSKGKDQYEKITNTSIALAQLKAKLGITLIVLCQMNREVERRPGQTFQPMMSDIRGSGQLGQDADVICFLCWPSKLNPEEPKEKFQFFIAKNRNREIKSSSIVCRFVADRQMFLEHIPADFEDPLPKQKQRRYAR